MTEGASKAFWLARVRDSALCRYVPAFIVITVWQWRADPNQCLLRIYKQFRGTLVAVRSSRVGECTGATAQAGRYRSVGTLDSSDSEALRKAITAVVKSYGDSKDEDELLVQTWISESIAVLGATSAAATQYPGTASVSYHVGNETYAVTAGSTNVQRFWLLSGARATACWPSPVLRAFMLLTRLEKTLNLNALELEIAVDRRGRLRLLQVTPSTSVVKNAAQTQVKSTRRRAQSAFQRCVKPRAGELGRTTVFGLMPDWNPAELIGEHPRALAASLFDTLITRRTWREARIALGYRRSEVHPLMTLLAGRPYVDARASLNSLIPGALSDDLARPVIEASIQKLRLQPSLHDRIEIELQPTCTSFAEEWRQQLAAAGLNTAEQRKWQAALVTLESRWMTLPSHEASVRVLRNSLHAFHTSIATAGNDVRALAHCLTHIEQAMALPFAAHARLAFVARFQLTSLVTAGAIAESRLAALFTSMVVTQSRAAKATNTSGTQRPSTFDIRVAPVEARDVIRKRSPATISLTHRERHDVNALLASNGIQMEAENWLALSRRRIELREHTKYILSNTLSYWLSALTRWGAMHSFEPDDLSHINVSALIACRDITQTRQRIEANRQQHERDQLVRMPILIAHQRDLHANTDSILRPTFIGRGRVSGRIKVIDRFTKRAPITSGTIVLIRAADPGYDWIFGYPIVALVTCFGGPHSHMAIRCNELALPCALGCGEGVYETLLQARCISIDLEQQHLSIDA
jgi:glutamine kinase